MLQSARLRRGIFACLRSSPFVHIVALLLFAASVVYPPIPEGWGLSISIHFMLYVAAVKQVLQAGLLFVALAGLPNVVNLERVARLSLPAYIISDLRIPYVPLPIDAPLLKPIVQAFPGLLGSLAGIAMLFLNIVEILVVSVPAQYVVTLPLHLGMRLCTFAKTHLSI